MFAGAFSLVCMGTEPTPEEAACSEWQPQLAHHCELRVSMQSYIRYVVQHAQHAACNGQVCDLTLSLPGVLLATAPHILGSPASLCSVPHANCLRMQPLHSSCPQACSLLRTLTPTAS